MSSTEALRDPAAGPPVAVRRRNPSSLVSALRARLRASRLDRQLSCGTVSWRSPVHAARSIQLTSDRRRRRLARSLERLIEVTERPPRLHGSVVPPRREQVREAKPMIRAIVVRLRSDDPVDARGVAYLRELLCNGDSPVFTRSPAGALTAELHTVSKLLDVPD